MGQPDTSSTGHGVYCLWRCPSCANTKVNKQKPSGLLGGAESTGDPSTHTHTHIHAHQPHKQVSPIQSSPHATTFPASLGLCSLVGTAQKVLSHTLKGEDSGCEKDASLSGDCPQEPYLLVLKRAGVCVTLWTTPAHCHHSAQQALGLLGLFPTNTGRRPSQAFERGAPLRQPPWPPGLEADTVGHTPPALCLRRRRR